MVRPAASLVPLVLVAVGCGGPTLARESSKSSVVGKTIRASLPDADGKPVAIPLDGKKNVVAVWSPSCACKDRIAALASHAADFERVGAKLVLVAVLAESETNDAARAALASWGVDRPFVVDRGHVLRQQAEVPDPPVTMVLAANGYVSWVAPPEATPSDVVSAAR